MQNLAEKSYEYIRQKLSAGEYAAGQRLVNRTLASEIGVSVIPVREAIHRLASEGLLDHVPGSGAFVRKPNRQDLDNLYVLRDALESCAAAEAARFITASELAELQMLVDRSFETARQIGQRQTGYSSRRQLNRWLDDEQRFHELLIEASRNALLAKVVDEHRAISNVFLAQRNDPKLLTAEVAEETCRSKMALLEALGDGDAELTRRLMSQHIQRGRQMVTSFLDSHRK